MLEREFETNSAHVERKFQLFCISVNNIICSGVDSLKGDLYAAVCGATFPSTFYAVSPSSLQLSS